MKMILLASTLLLATTGASARLRIDLRTGIAAANFGERHLKIGARAGVGVEYLFGDRFGLRTGLFYTNKGAAAGSDPFDRARAVRLSYLDLPLEAAASLRLAGRTRLEIHAGPYVARRVRTRLPEGSAYAPKRWDAGVGLGADFIVGRFIVGPEVQYGLVPLAATGSDHNTVYALTLGYRF